MPASEATSHRYVAAWDKQYDPTSGLVLMGARPYDPDLGRFLAADPIDGGSLNNYGYAGQDPINNYDLDGTMALGLTGVEQRGPEKAKQVVWIYENTPGRPASPASTWVDTTNGTFEKVAKTALAVAKTYRTECALNGAIGGAATGGLGAVGGCAEGVFVVWLDRHAPPRAAETAQVASVLVGGCRIFAESPFGKAYAKALGQALCAAFYPMCETR